MFSTPSQQSNKIEQYPIYNLSIPEIQLKQRSQRQNQERCLSNHIASRWYRSPEVILVEKNYDQSVDIWALGCVLAELMQATYRDRDIKSRFLFPGTSCFPLSPCDQMKHAKDKSVNIVSSSDQLKMILQVLGP